jgi:DNA-binding GntR family transcriptional regulator
MLDKLPPLKERAYQAIKESILSGEYRGGQALSIGDLAEQFGVSRTPLREAVLLLEQEGLVEALPYRGTFVKTISPEEIAEVFEVRAVLEGLAVRLAAREIPQEELEAFALVLDSLDEEIADGEFEGYVENDMRFHEMILRYCGNTTLQALVRQLSDRIYRIQAYSHQISGNHMTKSHEEHRLLFKALMERDATGSERLMTEHIEKAGARIADLAARQPRG